MATLDEANCARQQHADSLAKAGVHALGVEEGAAFGCAGWVVVAWVAPDAAPTLPDSLAASMHGKTVDVRLCIRKSEPFEPQ